ncbi:hypothetical protein [Burkholderia sp. AU45388]|uniref:hypothetical protein n=1 Tax=Burkholderia sp. AU45388 TaxID=3059206 RepID=UPI00265644C9|nr:hypothetical protein [Burkholderia sp. AU45388]MDN7429110.1 hypothetical protein [Burkholderia sp. AU45388]
MSTPNRTARVAAVTHAERSSSAVALLPMAWHYTAMHHFESIILSEFILPMSPGLSPEARPIVWFSLNSYWEKSVGRLVIDPATGQHIRLSMQQMRAEHGKLIRFGIEERKLLRADVLCRRARVNDSDWRDHLAQGSRHGANPLQWCGSVKPVSVDGLVIESFDDAFRWRRFRW